MTGDLTAYYAARAGEYDRIYLKPERQADLAGLRDTVSRFATGRHVLEVACGTGYWTEVMAPAAASLTGIDRVPEVLAAARARRLPPHARLLEADAFDLERVPGRFDAAFAGFWCSHLRRDEMTRFLAGLHRRLGRGARVMLLDNRSCREQHAHRAHGRQRRHVAGPAAGRRARVRDTEEPSGARRGGAARPGGGRRCGARGGDGVLLARRVRDVLRRQDRSIPWR
jgi:ubiquinone/menaquinone biosynthesis C-methylase UbiE